jgi:hypothetical protein
VIVQIGAKCYECPTAGLVRLLNSLDLIDRKRAKRISDYVKRHDIKVVEDENPELVIIVWDEP